MAPISLEFNDALFPRVNVVELMRRCHLYENTLVFFYVGGDALIAVDEVFHWVDVLSQIGHALIHL